MISENIIEFQNCEEFAQKAVDAEMELLPFNGFFVS